MTNRWPEYEPTDDDHVQEIVTRYRIRMEPTEELEIPVWQASYTDGSQHGSSTFFGLDEDDGTRSERAAALMCFLWYERGVQYPLCRELARAYFRRRHI